jgi:hypothetical protein
MPTGQAKAVKVEELIVAKLHDLCESMEKYPILAHNLVSEFNTSANDFEFVLTTLMAKMMENMNKG